jgi:HEAT repeat protein
LHDSDVNLRRAVVEALARIRSGEALEALESALEDGEPSVRQAALAALAHLRKVHRPT